MYVLARLAAVIFHAAIAYSVLYSMIDSDEPGWYELVVLGFYIFTFY